MQKLKVFFGPEKFKDILVEWVGRSIKLSFC